jgi:hypothetical protein
MDTNKTDGYRFELTSWGLLIATAKGTIQLDLSPGEALALGTYLGGERKRAARHEQRLRERPEYIPSHPIFFLEGFKTGAHQFEYFFGSLTIYSLQRIAMLHLDPYHTIRLVDFIRSHRRRLMRMPHESEALDYFSFPNIPNYESPTRHPPETDLSFPISGDEPGTQSAHQEENATTHRIGSDEPPGSDEE